MSAFLLFQVQLLLGKEILPLFGGAPAVWTVCVLVFQILFLAGYGYSHGIVTWLPLRRQVRVHGALLGVSAVFLAVLGYFWRTPIGPGASWHPLPGASPTWTIAKFLICAIGLPFFLLSTTSPLMQHWFAKAAPKSSPYRLYALSNVGSLLGLLSYPFLIEPHMRLGAQGWTWSAGYGLFLVCFYFSVRSVARSSESAAAVEKRSVPNSRPRGAPAAAGWPLRLFWIGLAACASVLLLATTNLICQDIAVIPFLWVLPLSLYLVSFIVCFENDRWYRREIFYPLFAMAVALVIVVSLPKAEFSFLIQLAAFSAVLFAGCMVCHGEAARTRPSAESLTIFYFCIAMGGAAGGIVVSMIAPWIFPNYWEYPLGILGCMAVLLTVSDRERSSWWYTGRVSLALLILAGCVLLAPSIVAAVWKEAGQFPPSAGHYAAAALAAAGVFRYVTERRNSKTVPAPGMVRGAARIALALLTAGLIIPQKAELYHVIASSRNFYGVLSVVSVDQENYLALRYGNIIHGFQYRDPQRAHLPTGYYGPTSGANMVIRNWPQHPTRVGLVGMGVGTLAALAQPGDVFRFYEINPDVYKMSSGHIHTSLICRIPPGKFRWCWATRGCRSSKRLNAGSCRSSTFWFGCVFQRCDPDAPAHARGIRGVPRASSRAGVGNRGAHQQPDARPAAGARRDQPGLRAFTLAAWIRCLPGGPFSQSDWILLSRDSASLAGNEIAQHSEPFPGATGRFLDR